MTPIQEIRENETVYIIRLYRELPRSCQTHKLKKSITNITWKNKLKRHEEKKISWSEKSNRKIKKKKNKTSRRIGATITMSRRTQPHSLISLTQMEWEQGMGRGLCELPFELANNRERRKEILDSARKRG